MDLYERILSYILTGVSCTFTCECNISPIGQFITLSNDSDIMKMFNMYVGHNDIYLNISNMQVIDALSQEPSFVPLRVCLVEPFLI